MLDSVVHQELPRYEARGHHHPRPEPREQTAETRFDGKDPQAMRHRAGRAVAFVDLR